QQHRRRAYRQQKRVAHGKPQRQPKGAAVAGRTKRGGQRECCDRHQMICAEAVNETESEHGSIEHRGDYSWLGFGSWGRDWGLGIRSVQLPLANAGAPIQNPPHLRSLVLWSPWSQLLLLITRYTFM